MEPFFKMMAERRSHRDKFDSERKIPKEDMDMILESARRAPTPHNMQNFEIVVIEDKDVFDRISKNERPVFEEFVRENYPLLSFSKEELEERKIGILGNSFPKNWTDPKKWDELFAEKTSFPLGSAFK